MATDDKVRLVDCKVMESISKVSTGDDVHIDEKISFTLHPKDGEAGEVIIELVINHPDELPVHVVELEEVASSRAILIPRNLVVRLKDLTTNEGEIPIAVMNALTTNARLQISYERKINEVVFEVVINENTPNLFTARGSCSLADSKDYFVIFSRGRG